MDGSKTKIVALHGALGCGAQLAAALQPLQQEFEVFTPDLPGHGNLAGQAITLENCIAALRDFMLKNQLAGATVFGYSMGGYVALCAVQKYPELFGNIVTLGTKLDWNPEFAAKEIGKLDAQKMIEKIPAYVANLEKYHGKNWQDMLAHTASFMAFLGDEVPLKTDVYQRIMHPVTLCLAEADTMVTQAETEHAANMLPFGRFEMIANSKHPIDAVDMEHLMVVLRVVSSL